MRIKLLILLFATVFLCNCKKSVPDDNSGSYINATVDGKNYSSSNVTVIRTATTDDLFSFYAVTPDSLFIGIRLNPTVPSYVPGNYTFRMHGSQDATVESFTIKDSNSTTLLKWTTSQENNLSYFEIDRSADGSFFTELGNVTPRGNTSSTTNYTFTDPGNRTVQNFYYRLKIVNLDGSFRYSGAVSYSDLFNDVAYYGEKSILHKGFNGAIQVTSNDRTKRIVTGIFSFDYVNNSGQTKQVMNGKFKVLY